jgi:hypothetical protein
LRMKTELTRHYPSRRSKATGKTAEWKVFAYWQGRVR